jgi:hypothetical protein
MGFRNSLEWQIGSVKSEAIAFLTHGSFLTGQRERYVTVYPFAEIILNGHLTEIPSLANFCKKEVFIFCNFRPLRNCRPDLLAFSSKGDVFLVEAKQYKGRSEKSALKNLITGIKELDSYSHLLKNYARESEGDPYNCWNADYKNCYVKDEKHGFPELDKFVTAATSLHEPKDQRALFRKINHNVVKGKIFYGLAFNDLSDEEPFFPLDSFELMPKTTIKYKTNSTDGVNNSGYFGIDNSKIFKIVKDEWDRSLGQLMLFGVNKKDNKLRILKPS